MTSSPFDSKWRFNVFSCDRSSQKCPNLSIIVFETRVVLWKYIFLLIEVNSAQHIMTSLKAGVGKKDTKMRIRAFPVS
ncbi:Uncharacterised protein r2_g2106 [Pycnogonum litorale]